MAGKAGEQPERKMDGKGEADEGECVSLESGGGEKVCETDGWEGEKGKDNEKRGDAGECEGTCAVVAVVEDGLM
eukprot:358466-Chlamydomonas_euryale.AAC.3